MTVRCQQEKETIAKFNCQADQIKYRPICINAIADQFADTICIFATVCEFAYTIYIYCKAEFCFELSFNL